MTLSPPLALSLRMLAGAIVWAVHFLAVYGLTALACERGIAAARWLGISVVVWGIGVTTAIALSVLAVVITTAARKKPVAFGESVMGGIAALAAIAIALEALPAFMVPACA